MIDDVAEALPRAVALSWGVAENPHRGPKRELSIERIVETAIEIADADGLAAVSMSRVASSLGFTTMSLYRYVTSKDDLLLLMQEAVCDIVIPPESEDPGWRTGLDQWARAQLAMMRAHPWYADVPIQSVPMTPNNLAVIDWGLRALGRTPLSDAEKMSTILLVSSYVLAVGRVMRDVDAARSASEEPESLRAESVERMGATLAALVTDERFPSLAPLIRAGTYLDADDGTDEVSFGLERILDGISRLIDQRTGASAGREAPGGVARGAELRAGAAPARDATPRPDADYARDKSVRDAAKLRRDAEVRLREALKREREAIAKARERAAKQAARDAARKKETR